MDSSGGMAAPPPRPLVADHGPSPHLVMSAFAAMALPLLALVVAGVFVPLVRFIAGAWLVAVVALLVVGLPRVLGRIRGEREHARLAVDGDQMRYTDWQGNQVASSRAAISTVILLMITSQKRTSNLIVFRDKQNAPVMSIPAGVFSGESIDKFVSDLGIGPLRRKFINSKPELDAVAPGLQLAGFFVPGTTPFDRVPALRRIVLGLLIAMVALLVVFVVLGSPG